MKSKKNLYWIIPILAWMAQLFMSLNSFGQMRFEEFIESVQAPFWFEHRQIISGLHVNVGWYAFLLGVYKLFGFSLYTGKIVYLIASFISTFVLFYLLKKFFTGWIVGLILITIILSPTLLFINTLSLHWAMTYHLMIIILLLLYMLDFSKRRQSLILTGVIFLLMMVTWFFYQAVVFYIPSLVIFYWLKLKQFYGSRIQYGMTAVVAFLLPLLGLFAWVQNRDILIADSQVGGGLFRGGGRFEFSEQVFTQAWTDFLSDFFNKGVSHHFEVAQAEFSLVFPILTLALVFVLSFRLLRYNSYNYYTQSLILRIKRYILLAFLVIVFDTIIFSTTSDLGMPGMKRLTPMLASIYFLWVLVWWAAEKRMIRGIGLASLSGRSGGIWVIRGVLSLLLLHHLIVYPANLAAIREPSPFKIADWFDEQNPQKSLDEYVKIAQKQDLMLDCRPIVAQLGECSYDFIYPSVAGSCQWNRLSCHKIYGFDFEKGSFKELK